MAPTWRPERPSCCRRPPPPPRKEQEEGRASSLSHTVCVVGARQRPEPPSLSAPQGKKEQEERARGRSLSHTCEAVGGACVAGAGALSWLVINPATRVHREEDEQVMA